MVHFVGAGPGAPDLITVRGARLIGEADVIIYAGSLVNPALLEMKKESCRVCDSAKMTLEEVIETIKEAEKEGLTTVRLPPLRPSKHIVTVQAHPSYETMRFFFFIIMTCTKQDS